ncbi:MAG TPA: zinc-dependent metalloprotease [Candidatus Polarisedimenticolia bacterium]|jgi:hypothetical protein
MSRRWTLALALAFLAAAPATPAGPTARALSDRPGGPAGIDAAAPDDGVDDSQQGESARKKEEKKEGTGIQPGAAGAQGGKKPEEPPFDEVIKEAQKIDGLFTVYRKDDRYLLAIKPDQLDRDFMLSVTRETGTGEWFMLAAQVLGDGPVRFHKAGKRVQLLWRNPKATAVGEPEMSRAVARSFSDSLQGSSKLESLPDPDTKAILVDITPYFLGDYDGFGAILAQLLQTPYGVDRENSGIERIKGFPANVEIEARIHFTGSRPAPFLNLPDSRSFFVNYRYSLSEIPAAPDFMPRIADDRVGHFLTLYQDFGDDRRESTYVRYVTRWNLQKEEPYAAISRPKEPITYYLENSIPKQYRKAVADGILIWNTAFEKIGFKDAIVVKQQPDDADWDAADTRFATVRWFVATDSAFAIGPSRINPATGQIFDADIGVTESITRFTRQEFRELSDPVAAVRGAFEETIGTPSREALPGRAIDPRLFCDFGYGAMRQATFGRALAASRGMEPGSPAEEKYIDDFLTHVIAHEVGHTLGLRHNFRASVVQPVDQLQNTSRTTEQGLTGSVMDYIPVNLAAPGQKQGDYWQTHLGQYDLWAIEYAYKVLPGVKKPEDELTELRKIASRVAEPGNAYGSDEDTADPRTSRWDIGTDAIAYYKQRVALAHELWKKIPSKLGKDGEGYQVMRRSFQAGLNEFAPAIGNVTKFIGGVYANRDHVGDPQGRLPLQPVPAERQREALQFLRTELFASDSFSVPSDLLARLGPDRWWDFEFSVFRTQRLEFPLHDVVRFLQQATLEQLFRPAALDRLVDLEMLFPPGQKPFTLAEMFQGLGESIWSELDGAGAPRIDSFRRALQREHIKKLIDLVVRPASGTPEDAGTMARANLNQLKVRIDAALKGPALDASTRAHLEETRARIDAALTAHMNRLIS